MMLWLALAAATPPAEARVAALADPYRPGCALGVIEEGRLVQARGYGSADLSTGRPITPATAFNIASMSKQFTGAAAALLIAEGKLSEEDDVRRYLPELPDYGATIRVRDLLHHTSGLRNHMALAAFSPGTHLPTHEEALKLVFRQSALNYRPGTRHQYESPNYVLLAEIVARVSKMPFDQFLETRIFEPLGMEGTGFSSAALARAYSARPEGGFALQEATNKAFGSSGILSTVEDFALWLVNYDSGRIGGKGLVGKMTAGTKLSDGSPISYGYGLQTERDHGGVPGLTMISHGGQTAAYRSVFSWFPGRGFGAVLLCNSGNAPREAVGEIMDGWVKVHYPNARPAAPAAAAGRPLSVDETARFTGLYHDPEADLVRVVRPRGRSLEVLYQGQPLPLTYRGNGRFVAGEYGGYRFETLPGGGVRMIEALNEQAALPFTKVRIAAFRPVADFAGRYRSPDVDGEVVLEAKGEDLLLRYPAGEAVLKQMDRDAFAAPEQDFERVAFTRDAAGAVTGLVLTVTSGINRMRFERVS